jgi:dihydroorotate dehydrogenase electron transfer subunit
MKIIQDFTVKNIEWLNDENYIIEFQTDNEIPDLLPGNFAEIEISNTADVFLRRPFSIFDYNRYDKSITFYVKVIGKGTRAMGMMNKGDRTSMIYPLGNSFGLADKGPVLLVGGGSGVAPFLLLGRELKQKGIDTQFLIGGKSEKDILFYDQLGQYGEVHVTTEDGSAGIKGMVTDHPALKEEINDFTKIYTCGPDPMMKAIAKLATENNIECEASLENMMACGFGACLCCIVETHEGNKCVCTEGPVFNVKDLTW